MDESESLLQLLYLAPVGLVRMNAKGEVRLANPKGVQLLAPITEGDPVTNLLDSLDELVPDLRSRVEAFDEPSGAVYRHGRILPPRSSRERGLVLDLVVTKSAPDDYLAVLQDITKLVEQERQLRQDRLRFQAIFDGVRDYAIYSLDLEGTIDSWNRSGERLYGYTADETIGSSIGPLLARDEDGAEAGLLERVRSEGWVEREGWVHTKDGEPFWGNSVVSVMVDDEGDALGYSVITRDMTDRKQHEDELREMASTDSLTSLPNRRSFEDAARQWFGSPRGRSLSSSALMIDVDWFKQVNDTYGHEIGDLVLESLADVLRTSCRGSDIPARVGGEEFAILLPGTREDGASVVAERIRRGVEDLAIDTGQGTLRISVSVGVAEEATRDLDRLLRRADAALYRAKEQGRDRVVRASDSKRAPPRAIDAKGEPRARGVASTGLEKCQ